MNRYIRYAALIFTVCAMAHAQTPAKPSAQECFKAVESDYNFGKVDGGVPVKHTFVFKNTCTSVVEIDQVRASCGCTAAVISEKSVKPGGEAKIDVTFTPPNGTRGTVSKTVSVYLKDATEAHTTLRFSAEVKSYYDIEPRSFQLQGAEVGAPVNARVTMKNTGEKDLDVRNLVLSVTSYKDTVISGRKSNIALVSSGTILTPTSFTLKPGETRPLEIQVTPQYPGQILGSLRISTLTAEESVPITGVVQQPFIRR
ncbi:MAG: DUF1573 domain-containing protein [Ignavibacteriae bacterium]|nr:DUF1573 domain-containing protein [Ignavibacteriota bacterium]